MSSRKFGLNLVVVLAIAALFTGFWALINRPMTAPAWPEQISGFSYSPFRLGESPQKGQYPTEDEMRQEYAVAAHIVQRPDFAEGVRAVLVDKDRNPAFEPDAIDAVDPAVVAAIVGEA